MVHTAEGAAIRYVADLDHEVDQVLDGEDAVVENWVLRVDGLDEGPVFIYELNVVRIDPEIRGEHQVEEEFFTQLCVIDGES